MLIVALLMLQSATAEAPVWWGTRGVFKDGAPVVDDYRALNQGQLKNLMRAAVDEMNDTLPGGAGTTLNSLLATWRAGVANGTADNYAAVNVGQLKAMGKLVRSRLVETGLTPPAWERRPRQMTMITYWQMWARQKPCLRLRSWTRTSMMMGTA